MNREVWVASGHVGGFNDPLMDCKACKARFRADKLIEDYTNGAETGDGWTNAELEAYDPSILQRPQVIAANKLDALYVDEDMEDPVERLRREFEPQGIQVFPISAVSGQGLKELLYHVKDMLKNMDDKPVIFEKEFDINELRIDEKLPYTVTRDDDGGFRVEGPRIEKMLGYTNLDSERGFEFFQNFLKR